jgi:hypothetical protein
LPPIPVMKLIDSNWPLLSVPRGIFSSSTLIH